MAIRLPSVVQASVEKRCLESILMDWIFMDCRSSPIDQSNTCRRRTSNPVGPFHWRGLRYIGRDVISFFQRIQNVDQTRHHQ